MALGMSTLWRTVSGAARGAFSFGAKQADDALTRAQTNILRTRTAQWRAANPGEELTDSIRADLRDEALELAENGSASLLRRGMTAIGLGSAVGVAGLTGDAAIRGDRSLAASGLENIMNSFKNPDSRSDMEGLWERIIAFFREGFEQVSQAFGITSNAVANVEVDVPGATPPGGESLTTTFSNYAEGLAEDFDPSQWSISSTLNLGNAALNGATVGVTSTLGWAGGQALDILNVGNIFSDRDFSTEAAEGATNLTNRAWNATLGAPDLSGHWAHAINNTAGFVAPAVGALKIGRALSQAFGLANATTRTAQVADVTLRNAPSLTVGAP